MRDERAIPPNEPPSSLEALVDGDHLYRKGVFIGGSIFTMLVALLWLAERAFNLKLISAQV